MKKLSIVMPAYNEAKDIYDNLLKTVEIVSTFSSNFEIIAVNDGSKDQTEKEIERAVAKDSHIRLVSYYPNGGKGKAIRTGVSYATGEYIAFLDSDLDLSPQHLESFIKEMDETGAAAVIGSKLHKDSKIDYPFMRRVMSYGYYLMLVILFRLPIKDTQTGVKLFQAKVIKQIIDDVQSKGFAYDIEILTSIYQDGGQIVEMPIELVFQRGDSWGRIKLSDILSVAKDTMAVYRKMKTRKKYRHETSQGI